MLELTWVVNEKLAVEMADNKGTILHDAWTRYGRHYLALLAMYLMKETTIEGEEASKVVTSLLALSTLSCDATDNEAIKFIMLSLCLIIYLPWSHQFPSPDLKVTARKFDTDTHVAFIKNTFNGLNNNPPKPLLLHRLRITQL